MAVAGSQEGRGADDENFGDFHSFYRINKQRSRFVAEFPQFFTADALVIFHNIL
jgi:hypothetical protein